MTKYYTMIGEKKDIFFPNLNGSFLGDKTSFLKGWGGENMIFFGKKYTPATKGCQKKRPLQLKKLDNGQTAFPTSQRKKRYT